MAVRGGKGGMGRPVSDLRAAVESLTLAYLQMQITRNTDPLSLAAMQIGFRLAST
jgi:hypothetical protein